MTERQSDKTDELRGAYVPLTKEQIAVWRRCCLSHWISELTHSESTRQANALCNMAENSLLYAEEIQRLRDAPLPECGGRIESRYEGA